MDAAPDLELSSAGRILVVDDSPSVRRMLRKLLTLEGYEVVEAGDGREALEKIVVRTVDTVLLDVMMPEMDGIEVCKKIRATPEISRTPIVFLTASNDREFRRKGREAGCDDFLVKPFDEVELLARVRNSVKLKHYYDGLERERDSLRRAVDGHTARLDEASARLTRIQQDLRLAQAETILRLTRAAEFRDDETASHLQRMSHYCQLIALRADLGQDTAELLRIASPMHDVGKIGIPDDILLKPGRLTREEFELMKQHAEIGHRILSGSDNELVQLAARIAHTHHEKWDGSGYPRHLQAEDIPIEGRVAAIADVFDALTSARPYKRAWSITDAVSMLKSGRGSHFDPKLVDVFLGSMDEVIQIKERFAETDDGDDDHESNPAEDAH